MALEENYIVERTVWCTQTLIIRAGSAAEAKRKADALPHAGDSAVEFVVNRCGKAKTATADRAK